jgi:hypothetical protein
MKGEHDMKNVDYTIRDGKLNIEVDLSQDFGESTSGKTIIIASSEGNRRVEAPCGGVYFGLNVYKYPPRDEAA